MPAPIALGAALAVAGLHLTAESGGDATGALSRTWLTTAAVETTTDLADYAGVTVGVDRKGWTPEEMTSAAQVGGRIDDPRVATIGGTAIALGEADPSTPLSSAPLELLLPDATITVVGMGVMLNDVLPELTFATALDAATAVAGASDR